MDFHSLDDRDNDIPLDLYLNDSSATSESEDSYTKVKVLGRGAFGEAVLYRKTTTNELVVWKEINLERASENEKNGALNEVEILSQLDHINIIAYYNDFFDGSSLFIEMEYANDGSLYHKEIARNEKLFEEEEVLSYFYQLMSAICYIHGFGILHRDIKTLNIFVTKSKLIKLGDFGISKVLEETYGQAETCVGTPYYMSPELVKGEPYNQKSDIWACGCVLFELLTLQKVFQASNHLKLICSILEKEPGEISECYSADIRNIVNSTLAKGPTKRPNAEDILSLTLFENAKHFVEKQTEITAPLRRISSQRSISQLSTSLTPVVSTLTSNVFYWGGGKTMPQKLEPFSEGSSGLQVSAGYSHFAVVTIEKELYTWANIQGGMEIVGQLGHGNTAMYRMPKKVSFFDGVLVKKVACGEDFTVILSLTGEVYSCGSDYFGCIGCGNSKGDNVLTPVKINSFDRKCIKNIACGDSHVVTLCDDSSIYTWGCGEYGRLGLGDEDDQATPQLVNIPGKHASIVTISCGRDNTLILTAKGDLLAFGNNENNKMALNQIIRFKSREFNTGDIVHCILEPTPVRSLRSYRLVSVTSGKSHSAAIDEYGRLLTFGSNKHGQLGVGDYKHRSVPCLVKGALSGKEVVLCGCGDGFTVAATKDNHLFSWGSGENGRLGIHLTGKSNCSSPKPIFGSLHKVVSLSSRHWSTIILAEQMLSSKVIQTKAIESISEERKGSVKSAEIRDTANALNASESFKFDTELDDYANNKKRPEPDSENPGRSGSLQSDNGDTLPPWLVDEMENAEYIPMEEPQDDDVFQGLRSSSRSVRDTYRSIRETTKSLASSSCVNCIAKSPSILEVRIKELELENLRLTKIVKEQEIQMKTLERERDCYIKYSSKIIELTKSEKF